MKLKEIQKLTKKLELLDHAYERIDNDWSHYPYVRDILKDKLLEEKDWILKSIEGQIIEVEV